MNTEFSTRYFRRSIQACLSAQPHWPVTLAATTLLVAFVDFVALISFYPIISATFGGSSGSIPLQANVMESFGLSGQVNLQTALVVTISAYLLRGFLLLAHSFLMSEWRRRVAIVLYGRISSHRLYSSYERTRALPSALHIRDMTNASAPFDFVVAPVFSLALAMLMGALTVLSMLLISPLRTLLGLLFIVVIGGLLTRMIRTYSTAISERRQDVEVEVGNLLIRVFEDLREIKIFQLETVFLNRLIQTCAQMFRLDQRRSIANQSIPVVLETVVVVSLATLLLVVSVLDRGIGSLGAEIAFIALSSIRLIPLGSKVVSELNQIASGRPLAEPLISDIEQTESPQKITESRFSASVSDQHSKEERRSLVRLDRVSFRYQGSNNWVFKDFGLEVMPGERVAVVGQNGSGKSTLLDIVLGLLSPTSGSITYSFSADQGEPISYVPQFPVIFDGDLVSNVILNRERDLAPDFNLDQFCLELLSRIDPKSSVLPQHYNLDAKRLSGGQKQLIAFYRAILLQPQLLLLDEPNSALDNRNNELFHAKLAALPNVAILMITHKLESNSFFDRVIYLPDLYTD